MKPEELEKTWQEYLARRKTAAVPDEGFTERVMASVREWERSGEAAELARQPAPGKRAPARSPGARIWEEWRERLAGIMEPRPLLAFASLLLATAAAALYYLAGPGPGRPIEVAQAGSDKSGTRIKGGDFRLGFVLKRGGQVREAVSGGEYYRGDLLQAVYHAPGAGHFHLLSIDEAGKLSCYSCAQPDSLMPPGQEKTLPYALELDASPSAEVMVGVWSVQPIAGANLERILRAAWETSGHDLAGLEPRLASALPKGASASVFHLRKGRKKS